MNLMIVEDEPRLRQNLAQDMPWEEHGIEVVGAASSGEEALALFDRKKPDLMLLDIQMSGMSGLELAQRVHEKDPLVKMIILSGHDNFEYAQQAVSLGISKYLLKPAGEAEILQAVLEAAAELKHDLDQLHSAAQLEAKWREHLPFLKEMFLMQWLHGKFSLGEIEKRSRDVMLDVTKVKLYCTAKIDLDPCGESGCCAAREVSQLQIALKTICQQMFHPDTEWIASDTDGSTMVLFTSAAEDRAAFMHHVNASVAKLLSVVKECLKLTASAGISSVADHPQALNQLYEQSRKALQKRIVYGHHLAITYQGEYETETFPLSFPDVERELEIALETGNEAKCMESLDKLWRLVMGTTRSVDEVKEGLFYFTSFFVRMIHRHGCSVKEVAGEDIIYFQNLQSFATQDQVYELLIRISRHFLAHLESKRGAAGHNMVKAVIELVEERMEEDLTLHSVAEQLFINSSYLSRLFKKEMGQSFSSYVQERKMERAKAALLQGAKVYDAARAVGYRDVSYFTKVFRKYWGVTPGVVPKS